MAPLLLASRSMKLTPYIILALIAVAGVQKIGNRPGEWTTQRLTIEAERPLLGAWAPDALKPLALATLRDAQGAEHTVLTTQPRPVSVGEDICADVAQGRLLGDLRIAPGAKACG